MPGGGARRVLAALVVPAIAGAVALTATAPALPASAVSAAEAPPLRLRALDVHDRLAGSKAFRMLVPLGWRASGGIVWDFRYYTLASAVMQVRSPSGSEALETYPVIPHVWDTRGSPAFRREATTWARSSIPRSMRSLSSSSSPCPETAAAFGTGW